MTSGVQELRHNFRSKLLKFRSGWQLCSTMRKEERQTEEEMGGQYKLVDRIISERYLEEGRES